MSGLTALATQAAILLLVVALLGGVVGWLFGFMRGSSVTSRTDDQQLRATLARMSEAEGQVITLRARLQEASVDSPPPDASGQPPAVEAIVDSEPAPEGDGDALPPTASTSVDDLTRIKGIGAVMARTLNEIGIMSFGDLARLSQAEIAELESRVASLRGRIGRGGWVASAEALQRADYELEPGRDPFGVS